MNSVYLIFRFSILLAVVIGLIRFRKMAREYRPFVIICSLALVNELIMIPSSRYFGSDAVSSNIYMLVDTLLWIWLFRNWGLFRKMPGMPYWLGGTLLLVWLTENVVLGKIWNFNAFFWIIGPLVVVFAAIHQINELVVRERTSLLKNAKFLITAGIMIFSTYLILVQSFYIQLDAYSQFVGNLFSIVSYVNLFANLLYALAALWIPTRQRFILQY